MFRLMAVTLAALYAVLHVYGDPDRRPSVAREAVNPEMQELTLANFVEAGDAIQTLPASQPMISDAEAVRLALAAGEAARADRPGLKLRGADVAAKTEIVRETPKDAWYVSGSRVNLREGPGTNNAVVGQVSGGMEAEVIESRDGWHQIRTIDGSATGWIFARFLSNQRPG